MLIGGAGHDVLDGGAGDNVIISAALKSGGPQFHCRRRRTSLDLTALDVNFDWLMAHASDVNGDVLDLGAQHITLNGVSSSMLHENDFILG